MGRFFNNFRTRLWKKGFAGGGTSWAKTGEVWKCGRKMGNSPESGLTRGGSIGQISDPGKEKGRESGRSTGIRQRNVGFIPGEPRVSGQGRPRQGLLGVRRGQQGTSSAGDSPGPCRVGASAQEWPSCLSWLKTRRPTGEVDGGLVERRDQLLL